MKKIKLIIIFALINFVVSTRVTPLAFGGPEGHVLVDTLTDLKSIGTAISAKWNLDGKAYTYPEGPGMPCESSQETGSPCWAYSITNPETNGHAYAGRMMENLGVGGYLLVDMAGLRGDVRFRCRTQGHQTYCFAYRCLNPAPAGCKQIWRIEWKVNGYHVLDTPAKCVQGMPWDGVGEDWSSLCDMFDPDPNHW